MLFSTQLTLSEMEAEIGWINDSDDDDIETEVLMSDTDSNTPSQTEIPVEESFTNITGTKIRTEEINEVFQPINFNATNDFISLKGLDIPTPDKTNKTEPNKQHGNEKDEPDNTDEKNDPDNSNSLGVVNTSTAAETNAIFKKLSDDQGKKIEITTKTDVVYKKMSGVEERKKETTTKSDVQKPQHLIISRLNNLDMLKVSNDLDRLLESKDIAHSTTLNFSLGMSPKSAYSYLDSTNKRIDDIFDLHMSRVNRACTYIDNTGVVIDSIRDVPITTMRYKKGTTCMMKVLNTVSLFTNAALFSAACCVYFGFGSLS
jgi:hypothetical protein